MAVIRIGIDPNIHLGPLTLAWHGITIALGIAIGAIAAYRSDNGQAGPSSTAQPYSSGDRLCPTS